MNAPLLLHFGRKTSLHVWIKSMNVMDDNKVLTLVPYERLPEGLCFDYFYDPKSGEQVQWLSEYLRPAQGKENVIFHR